MIKEVPCMDCDGKGFIAIFSEYSVWSERCQNCGGTGIVKVPMTNADRIRAMSDEELAEFISRIEIGDFGPQVYGKHFAICVRASTNAMIADCGGSNGQRRRTPDGLQQAD